MKTDSTHRLKELIVYISQKCADDSAFGKTKLNKILFLADFNYYIKNRKSISGQDYIHLDFGPVPEEMNFTLKEMNKRDIALAIQDSGPFKQERVVALREADLSGFQPEMIAFLDEIINEVCYKHRIRATWLSEFTHDFLGWLATSKGEIIPYQTAFLKTKKRQMVNESEKLRAVEIARYYKDRYGFAE